MRDMERVYRRSRHHVTMSVTARHTARRNFWGSYLCFTFHSPVVLRSTCSRRRRDRPFWRPVDTPHFLIGYLEHERHNLETLQFSRTGILSACTNLSILG